MKLKIEAVKKVDDGMHVGVIKAIEYRTQPFSYTDVVIEMENGIQIKAGYPTMVTPESKLGQLLTLFGAVLDVGKEIEPEAVLIGKRCKFMTMNETTERGTFAKVVPGSLKHLA